jgi:hypothetical protein
VRRVAWFRCVVDIEDERIAQPWLTTAHAMFEQCLMATVDATEGKVQLVQVEGGQSFGIHAVQQDEDV